MNLFGKDPRPTFNDEMEKQLIEKISKEVFQWCQQNNENQSIEDIQEALEEVFEFHINDNGYEIAKELEDTLYISPNADLCEILDGVWFTQNEILNRYIKNWIQTDDIKPELQIGDIVKTPRGEGDIVSIQESSAQYGVHIEAANSIRGKRSALINFEDCELVKKASEMQNLES